MTSDSTPLLHTLEAARGVIEARFLKAGEVLSAAVEGIGTLIAALNTLTQALSPASIGETERMLAAGAARLAALPDRQNTRHKAIVTLATQQAQLSSQIADMRRILAYMRAFIVSIKITAGAIGEADAEFGIFAQEMFLRVECGRVEVDALDQGLATLKEELQDAARNAEGSERRCAAMIPEVHGQLLTSAAAMGKHHSRIANATVNTGQIAHDIRKKVARMLGALQIGDITRQRIEHVQAGIALLDRLDPALPANAAARIRALMHGLLAALLEAALADYSQEVAQLGAGLAGLGRDATALLSLRDLTYGETYGETAEASGGVLRILEERIGTAVGLVDEIETTDAKAQDTGRSAASAAQSLAGRLETVQTIKTDVLYMALNTSLKSARIGDAGRPLSIIASELRVQSVNLETIATNCGTALQTLLATAALVQGDDAGEEHIGTALLATAARIKAAGAAAGRDVAILAVQGEAVQTLLASNAQGLEFRAEIGERLEQMVQALRGLAAGAAPCTEEIRAPLEALFAKLRTTYTMAQERNIQSAFAADWGMDTAGTASPGAVAPNIDLEDALF